MKQYLNILLEMDLLGLNSPAFLYSTTTQVVVSLFSVCKCPQKHGPNVVDISSILRSTTNPPKTSLGRPSTGSRRWPARGVALQTLT